MPAYPKPPRKEKRRTWLSKMGNKAWNWEAFKLQIVYPSLWVRYGMEFGVPGAVSIVCECDECKCAASPNFGYLELLDKPDEHGRMWEVTNLDIHHDTKRSKEPSEVFVLKNCRPNATQCHEKRHQP